MTVSFLKVFFWRFVQFVVVCCIIFTTTTHTLWFISIFFSLVDCMWSWKSFSTGKERRGRSAPHSQVIYRGRTCSQICSLNPRCAEAASSTHCLIFPQYFLCTLLSALTALLHSGFAETLRQLVFPHYNPHVSFLAWIHIFSPRWRRRHTHFTTGRR